MKLFYLEDLKRVKEVIRFEVMKRIEMGNWNSRDGLRMVVIVTKDTCIQ